MTPSLAAVATSVEMLSFVPQSNRADLIFAALARASQSAGVRVTTTPHFRGGSNLLVLWGPGAPDRVEPMRRQVEAGGHVACFDLAYWDRDHKVRVSIDAAHPQRWVMTRDWPMSRFTSDRVPVTNAWKPNGPVIVAGLGDKARVQYGAGVIDAWEADMMAEARQRGCAVQYRAKRGAGPIEPALRGAALVITWHSNVAVDAIRMGIPVLCRDGAAAAVCASDWPATGLPEPLPPALRARFLANLAWFQWGTTPAEAKGCWAFLQELLS